MSQSRIGIIEGDITTQEVGLLMGASRNRTESSHAGA